MLGNNFDPSQMQEMMEQFGIDMEELNAETIEVELEDGGRLVFQNADLMEVDAQGQTMYQIVGEPDEESGNSGDDAGEAENGAEDDGGIPDADVELVAQRAGVTESEARNALEETGGDLAAAVKTLK